MSVTIIYHDQYGRRIRIVRIPTVIITVNLLPWIAIKTCNYHLVHDRIYVKTEIDFSLLIAE